MAVLIALFGAPAGARVPTENNAVYLHEAVAGRRGMD